VLYEETLPHLQVPTEFWQEVYVHHGIDVVVETVDATVDATVDETDVDAAVVDVVVGGVHVQQSPQVLCDVPEHEYA
jgi:hypothetical protein